MKMKDYVLICRCEEVTRGEVIAAIKNGHHSVASIKKATRAGMGPCQGRTCSRLIEQLLASEGIETAVEKRSDKFRFPLIPAALAQMLMKED